MVKYRPKKIIPVYEPFKAPNQKKYVLDCLNTNWISSRGKYVDQFEQKLQEFLGVKHVTTCCNGSVSLMLILKGLNIGLGDEVIVPSLTYAATISTINLAGAVAVLTDSDTNFQMDLSTLEDSLTEKTKAIMVPQLYGDAPNMGQLLNFCVEHHIALIEDSAEAFGCVYQNTHIGAIGDASSFSFFANKSITTGEGGCVCTQSDELNTKLRLLKNQSHIGGFMHNGPGFNFRMTNIQAAIGLAQLEVYQQITEKKQNIAEYYRYSLDPSITKIVPKIKSAEWMPLFMLPPTITYSKFQKLLNERKVDCRPAFTPIHLMEGFNTRMPFELPIAEAIYQKGFNLPSYPGLKQSELAYIVEQVNSIIKIID